MLAAKFTRKLKDQRWEGVLLYIDRKDFKEFQNLTNIDRETFIKWFRDVQDYIRR
jgi:hypothetical protein